jgi:prepilin-type N-terminal cleavage/methylation domain-containing protein
MRGDRTRPDRGPERRRGFTLVEFVVALAIFEVVLLGVAGLLRISLRSQARSLLLEQVAWEVGGLADSLAGVATAGSGVRDYPWGEIRWDGGLVTARDSVGAVLVSAPIPAAGAPAGGTP